MMSHVLTATVLTAAGATVLCALGRLMLVFRAVRRLFDGGHRAIAPLLDRVAASVGAPSVSMLVDLGATERPAALLASCLAQRYGRLDVVAVAASSQVPTDVRLAFDLEEVTSTESAVVYRSRRDERLLVLVPSAGAATGEERLAVACRIASGELVCPVHDSWQLHSGAIAELAGSWIRRPELLGSFGVLHPTGTGPAGLFRLVSIRADLLAAAGLGDGVASLGALGAIASGQVGGIVGLIEREIYLRVDGMGGDLAQPGTWAGLAARLIEDCYLRGSRAQVRLHPRPMGHVEGGGRAANRDLTVLPAVRGATPPVWRVLWGVQFVPWATAVGVAAGLVGAVTGQVSADVLLVAGSAPLVLATAIVLGLMMDDRALRPVRSSRRRLSLVLGAVAASVGGVLGSPLRGATGQFH